MSRCQLQAGPELVEEITRFLRRWEAAWSHQGRTLPASRECRRLGETELAAALESCCRLSAYLQHEAVDLADLNDYLQFLNHELRTPLTAAETALRSLSSPTAPPDDAAQRELIDIAMRNLRRLNRTAAWCEDYLAGRTPADPVRSPENRVHTLVAGAAGDFPDVITLEFGDAAAPRMMCGDGALFCRLLRQVLRALHYLAPGVPLALRVEVRNGHDDLDAELQLTFTFHTSTATEARVGNVARTQLVSPDRPADDELPRLLQFTVSPGLQDVFGARLEPVVERRHNGPVLAMSVPITGPAAVGEPGA